MVAAIALVALGGWAVLAARSDAPDPLFTRDHLVAGDAVVVTYRSAMTDEAYRFISLKGRGWVWSRTTPDSSGIDGTLISTGKQYLLQISDACFIALPHVDEPFMPGLTDAAKLQSSSYGHNPDGSYTYETPAASLISYAPTGATVSVTEELSQLEHADGYSVVTSGKTPWLWYGSYHIAPATAAERDQAVALLARATASKTASVQFRERLIWSNVTAVLLGPFDVYYPDDCPALPVQLRPASLGGQIGGARATPPDIPFKAGLAVDHGIVLPFPIFATRDQLFDAIQGTPFSPARAPTNGTVLIVPNDGATMAIQVTSCSSSAAFQC